jgi:acetoin utilization protein AcuA
MSCGDKRVQHLPGRPAFNKIEKNIIIRGEDITLSGPVPGEQLNRKQWSEGLHCFRPACKQQHALAELALCPDGLVFTASRQETIIAYAAFQKPDFPWWRSRCFPCLLELGSLETDPAWRRSGITSALLEAIFCDNQFTYFEHFIVFAVQLPYNWDLSGTGLEPWAYRRMMIGFLKKYGFHPQETADPEITDHPGGVLLVRTGRFTDGESKSRFISNCLHPGD